ncbi:MAG: 30S ribosomal protein S6 [Candidatus Binataceae bacterium]
MRRYETVFILRPDLGEAQTKETIKRFEGIVGTGGGDLIETDEWGVRELAYRIQGERRGYYVRLDYVAQGATTTEVERNLKLTDSVLRYLSVLVDPDADLARVRAEVEAHRQRREAAAAAKAALASPAEPAAERRDETAAESSPAEQSATPADTGPSPSDEEPAPAAPPSETAAPSQEPNGPEGDRQPD